MAGHEPDVAERWIDSVLIADTGGGGVSALTGGRIFGPLAWPGTVWPYVVYAPLSDGVDRMTMTGTRLWTDMLYLIQAVDQRWEYDRVTPIAARIDLLFHQKHSITIAGVGYIQECVREMTRRQSPDVGGVRFVYAGGIYRIKATAT